MAAEIIKKLLWYALITFALSPFNVWGYSEEDCIRCHRSGSAESKLQIDVLTYGTSIHAGEVNCVDCHTSIIGDQHCSGKDLEKVNCSNCHEQKCLHGGDAGVQCTDCHTQHAVYSADDRRSSVYWRNMKYTCGACHPAQAKNQGVLSKLASFQIVSHPKQDMSEPFDKGMCVGCHQGQAAHGEDGPINKQNCYKCHPPFDKRRIILGYMHPYADWRNKPVNSIAGCISVIALLGIIFVLVRDFVRHSGKRKQDHDGGRV